MWSEFQSLCYVNEFDKEIIEIYMENSFDVVFCSNSRINYWNIDWNTCRWSCITRIHSLIIQLRLYCSIIFRLMHRHVLIHLLHAPILPPQHYIHGLLNLNLHNHRFRCLSRPKIRSFIPSRRSQLRPQLCHRHRCSYPKQLNKTIQLFLYLFTSRYSINFPCHLFL
jgi:hypothetical protein